MTAAQISEMLDNARTALNALLTGGNLKDTRIGDVEITNSTTIRELRSLITDLEKQLRAVPAIAIRHTAGQITRMGGDGSIYIGDEE